MITIRTIVALAKNGLLKDCVFLSTDTSLAAVEVRNNEVFFTSIGARIPASSVSENELDRIENDNDYFLKAQLWVSYGTCGGSGAHTDSEGRAVTACPTCDGSGHAYSAN